MTNRHEKALAPRLLTAAGATTLAVAIAAVYVAWCRPSGVPVNLDLTVVESEQAALPFYELVFDYTPLGDDWNFADPHLRRRGVPLLAEDRDKGIGPHDILGFRNRQVPTQPEIVVIGDSQTYGLNAPIDESWPALLAAESGLGVYNMSMAGWGGLSYLYMTPKALALRPELVLVTLYMGNDSIENVLMAYGGSYWQEYRPRPELTFEQIPMEIRVRPHESLPTGAGRMLPFQTAYRFDVNNPDSLAVSLGYEIQKRAVTEIVRLCREAGTAVAFTILPTKEFLYARDLRARGVEVSDEYLRLVSAEAGHAEELRRTIDRAGGVRVEVAAALQARIERGEELYPASGDGHPASPGYSAMAEVIHSGLARRFPRLAG